MKKLFLISTLLLTTASTNVCTMEKPEEEINFDILLANLEKAEPEFPAITEPEIPESKNMSIKAFIDYATKCLKIKISCDKESEKDVLDIPTHIIAAFDEFEISAQHPKIKQMTKNTLLEIIKGLISEKNYSMTYADGIYKITKIKLDKSNL